MSTPEDLTPEEAEKAQARADEAFIAEQDAKVEEADARETAKEQASEEDAAPVADAATDDAPAADTTTTRDAPAPGVDEPAAPARRRRGRRGGGSNAQPEPAPRAKPAKRRSGDAAVVVKAQAKYVRTSARKARLVCDHIRGKDVEQARAILAFTPRAAAEAWSKLLESAVANAENNHELVGDELRIASVHADEGPTLKRFRPRAMGRATKIRKRTSHLSITLTPKD
jgi:ribosomal protein L22